MQQFNSPEKKSFLILFLKLRQQVPNLRSYIRKIIKNKTFLRFYLAPYCLHQVGTYSEQLITQRIEHISGFTALKYSKTRYYVLTELLSLIHTKIKQMQMIKEVLLSS